MDFRDKVAPSALRHPITVEEYDRMGEAGIFDPTLRLELINGEIFEMTPSHPPHGSGVDRLNMFFASRVGGRAIVRVQGPVHMGRYSEPLPDILLLKHRDDYYRERHPQPEDVLLLVEVAQSSLAIDRNIKGPLYRGEAIVEYWIVNINDQVVEVQRHDMPRVTQVFRRGDTLKPVSFPDLALPVEDILGRCPTP